jgi:hypothetical protein
MIYFGSPYKTKDIGGACNAWITHLPDDATICITDGDILFLQSDYGDFIQQIINDNAEYDLIGAMTNRVGVEGHLVGGVFSNYFDMKFHKKQADRLRKKYNTEVKEADIVAGFCMIFNKHTWARVGGFKENSVHFDGGFSRKVDSKAIAKGLYLYHHYRTDYDNVREASSNYRHLL